MLKKRQWLWKWEYNTLTYLLHIESIQWGAARNLELFWCHFLHSVYIGQASVMMYFKLIAKVKWAYIVYASQEKKECVCVYGYPETYILLMKIHLKRPERCMCVYSRMRMYIHLKRLKLIVCLHTYTYIHTYICTHIWRGWDKFVHVKAYMRIRIYFIV